MSNVQETSTVRRNVAGIVLLLVGLLQLAGVLSGNRVLRGIGAASGASPLPKVFSDVKGLETFASDFIIEYELDAETVRVPVTPDYYQKLGGPYNRRNVYGAALSYGPRLPRDLWEAVFCYGLALDGPFHSELNIPDNARGVRVIVQTKTKGRDDVWVLQPTCAK